MADFQTAWGIQDAIGDWVLTTPSGPVSFVLGTEGGAEITTEGGVLIATEPLLLGPAAVDLSGGADLLTAVLISIFTDRTAEPADVIPDGTTDPRGWWGDLGAASPIGSRLWLLSRAKALPATKVAAQGYLAEALQWLKDDGVVSAIDLYVEWTTPTMLGCRVTLHQPPAPPKVFAFANVWKQVS